MRSYSFKSTINYLILALLLAGIALRLYRIAANDFLFYDEGMYLGQSRGFLDLITANPPKNIQELWIILGLMFKMVLSTPKALWFFILDLRAFFLGTHAWYFARLISAAAGLATVGLTYVWAKRYFQSRSKAILSALILLVLPSHVFYSRLGMQESLSTLLFLAGMYLYVFAPRGVSVRSCAAAVMLSAVYFTNYRMIIAPVFVIIAQALLDRSQRKSLDVPKLVWFLAIFGGIVLAIGALYGGTNLYVTCAWMFHQAGESQSHWHLINFLSFPYYFFTLDNALFAIFFFAGFYFLYRRQWEGLMPLIIVLVQMFLFSFAAEKGARYLCVVLPFATMAVADTIVRIKDQRPKYIRVLNIAIVLMFVGLLWQSFVLAKARTGYATAVSMVLAHDPAAKIISTQPLVEGLFLQDAKNIVACPKDPEALAILLSQGYRYLMIDPQVYISWTADDNRFTQPLIGLLETIRYRISPVAVVTHLDQALLRRFVLDHNQDLLTSVKFLHDAKAEGNIYIYDLRP